MQNGAKRLMALLPALVMAGSLAATPASAASGEPDGGSLSSDILNAAREASAEKIVINFDSFSDSSVQNGY